MVTTLPRKFRFPLWRCVAGIALGALPAFGSDFSWRNIQFGGFASQGYLKSSANDYLGDTSEGTFDFREYAANASWSGGKWRVGAQAFGQKLGVYGDDKIKLDWATVDYQATQWFGLRAGKVKMPRGLYNEALDLDSVRPFVLLPQSVYDNRLRDFNASFNGAMIYGNVAIGKAGSLDYRGFYGKMPVASGSGALDYFNNDVPFNNVSLEMDNVRGGTLFWNTPIAGLRTGYSYSAFKNMSAFRTNGVAPAIFLWNKVANNYDRHLVSTEYITGNWVFAAEAGREAGYYDISRNGARFIDFDFSSKYFYASAARRINRRLEVGAYYSHSVDYQWVHGKNYPAALLVQAYHPPLKQGDYALSARFDINEHVIFKLEGHYVDGAGKIFHLIGKAQPVSTRDNSWTMLAAKMTVSF